MVNKKVIIITAFITIANVFSSIYLNALGNAYWFIPIYFILLILISKNKNQFIQEILHLSHKKEIMFALLLIVISIVLAFLKLDYMTKGSVQTDIIGIPFFVFTIGLLIQAFSEEVMFRCYLLNKLQGSPIFRILLSSILFMLAHLASFNYASTPFALIMDSLLIRFFVGFVLALCYGKHSSIYEVTILHFIFNYFYYLLDASVPILAREFINVVLFIYVCYVVFLYRREIVQTYHKIKYAYRKWKLGSSS